MKIEVIINGRVYLIKAKYQEQSSGIKTPKQFHAMVFNEKKACPTFFGIGTFCLNTIIVVLSEHLLM